MPLAVTHVLLTIVLLDIFRDYIIKKKKLIPLNYLFIGGVAGLLPDIDIPVFWLLNNVLSIKTTWFHGTYTHIFLIPIVLGVVAFFAYKYNKKTGVLLGVIAFGYFLHVLLDFLFYGTNLSPFWPLLNTAFTGFISHLNIKDFEMGLDAFILLAWLWHEEVKHKIRDFI